MEFIVLGGILFWLITALFLIGVFTSIYQDNGSWATGSLIFYFIVMSLFGQFSVIGFMTANPLILIVVLASYFMAGIFWTFMKWKFYVSDSRRKFDDHKAEWLENKGISDGKITNDLKALWTEEARQYACNCSESPNHPYHANELRTGTQIVNSIKPKVRRNKSKIIFWLTYWPFSLVYALCCDAVVATWNYIYHGIGKRLQKISDNKFQDVDADFDTSNDPMSKNNE